MSKILKVEPSALRQMGDTLATLSGENIQAETYTKEWISPSGDEGGWILTKVTTKLAELETQLADNYARLGRIISGSSIQVSNAAYMYESMDYAHAAALDSTYPGASE